MILRQRCRNISIVCDPLRVWLRRSFATAGNVGYKTVTTPPNLVGGDPEGTIDQSLSQTSWGGAPSYGPLRSLYGPFVREAGKVALGPSATEADAHTFASLRSLQPRVLLFVLSRAALLTPPRPAQPLLLTADSAGSSVFSSPIGVTIAAARPCMFIECVSAKNACPACARFDACTC